MICCPPCSGSRSAGEMYRRVVLALYGGGRGHTAGALTSSRYTDHILKFFSLGSVHCSEKKPPKDHVSSNPPAEEKLDVPHGDDSSQPPQRVNLKDILSGMKVEVSAKEKFLEKRKIKQAINHETIREGLKSSSKMFQMASEAHLSNKEKVVSPKMGAAVSAVASTFPGKEKYQVESELLQQLRVHKEMAEKQRKGQLNISNIITGMQINPQKKRDQVKLHKTEKRTRSKPGLFTAKRLNIFPTPPDSEQTAITESSPTLWDIELAKEIAAAGQQPPRNGFEEMIQWTNEGKLWTFPINNEAGLDEEQKVEFHEHIFLDKYLEDIPKQGPIRHFMELVVCGLSKNPYLTVQQKKEHIDWFRNYFVQKEDVLRECEV